MADTKTMNEQGRHLEGKGELDYDYVNDILFFKIANREYGRSLELDNLVVDIDSEDFIVGLQIFDASHFLNIPKANLKINKWQFKARITPTTIEIRLTCLINLRNKIKELNPIIVQQRNVEHLPNSQMVVAA